jgi:hypothetical protein
MTNSVTLLISEARIDAELDTGGEIGEVSQCLTDGAMDSGGEIATRLLPSGKLGWQDAACFRLPVGFLPQEWEGRPLVITFSLNEPDASDER